VRSCTLRAGTTKERNDWLDALHTAIEDHVMRKRTFKEQSKLPVDPPDMRRLGEAIESAVIRELILIRIIIN
jgi:hypothetical protein